MTATADSTPSAPVPVTTPGRSVERDHAIFVQTVRRARAEGVDSEQDGIMVARLL